MLLLRNATTAGGVTAAPPAQLQLLHLHLRRPMLLRRAWGARAANQRQHSQYQNGQGRGRRSSHGYSSSSSSSSSSYSSRTKFHLGVGAAAFAAALSIATPHDASAAAARADGMSLSYKMLEEQDSVMSAAIIRMYESDRRFTEVSRRATAAILKRDEEDGEKLQQGIDLAIRKGVIPKYITVEPVCKITVTGKTAEQVADGIIAGLGSAANSGCVMTLQGLSGTGKGTTVAMLKKKLPNATTWSNGNIFRSLTLLAATYAEQNNVSLAEATTPKLLDSYAKMLTFGKFNGKFDVKISGLGLEYMVSEVANTVLKGPKVGKNIPTVASVTQGEVINFVQDSLKIMTADGVNVLLEGREQTLNYIRTPHRFELVLNDVNVIGMRRAAQRMGAAALKEMKDSTPWWKTLTGGPSAADVKAKLDEVLNKMEKEDS